MSRESVIPPTIIAGACVAGAVALGVMAEKKFSEANPWEAFRDRAAAEIAAGRYALPDESPLAWPNMPTLAELEYHKNRAGGRAFGYNMLGGASAVGSVVLGLCALNGGWRTIAIARGRREDESLQPAVPFPEPEQ